MKKLYQIHIIATVLTMLCEVYCIYSSIIGEDKASYSMYYDLEDKFVSFYAFFAMIVFVLNILVGIKVDLNGKKRGLTLILGGTSLGLVNILMWLYSRVFDMYLMYSIHLVWFITTLWFNFLIRKKINNLFMAERQTEDILDAPD
jgi:hypothetical protein